MNLDASSRHSEGYFFEAKPVKFLVVLPTAARDWFTHHNRDTTRKSQGVMTIKETELVHTLSNKSFQETQCLL